MQHKGEPTCAGSQRYFTVAILLVFASTATAGGLNQQEFRQSVANMKADIKDGRVSHLASSSSSSSDGECYLYTVF